ncbi:transglutaminase domain-containing protein [Paenibacillus crassostreae]|uniref:Cysteine protease n=1 Tax=Paenibacillus crassostreae TaxID=1763538 RepID=A0A167AKB6_9BACL|nr:cysteine protease [Paenibacillus crassostreae]OAB71129.1 cysteine protease [Paenibacillus crassostreae]
MVTMILVCILVVSLFQGWRRGASNSVGRLLSLLRSVVLTLLGLVISIPFTIWMSPLVQGWLADYSATLSNENLSKWSQVYYTVITSMADFPLMRFAVLFIVNYSIIRLLFSVLIFLLPSWKISLFSSGEGKSSSMLSRLTGMGFGGLMGATRCIVVVAILFIYVTLYPASAFSRHVEASPVYQDGAQMIIVPLSGDLVKEKLPVFTKAVEQELNGILQRRYEVIDSVISEDIAQAAIQITEKAESEEEKARLLYDWVGSRVSYDYNKVDDYEQKGIWHEQTPQDTFDTKLGVCIDYARLYAVMARSVDIEVKVVTGLGYNGQGGYGPHAWNEVYLTNTDEWVPLDPTWAQSGNWFNPPKFAETHIEEQIL